MGSASSSAGGVKTHEDTAPVRAPDGPRDLREAVVRAVRESLAGEDLIAIVYVSLPPQGRSQGLEMQVVASRDDHLKVEYSKGYDAGDQPFTHQVLSHRTAFGTHINLTITADKDIIDKAQHRLLANYRKYVSKFAPLASLRVEDSLSRHFTETYKEYKGPARRSTTLLATPSHPSLMNGFDRDLTWEAHAKHRNRVLYMNRSLRDGNRRFVVTPVVVIGRGPGPKPVHVPPAARLIGMFVSVPGHTFAAVYNRPRATLELLETGGMKDMPRVWYQKLEHFVQRWMGPVTQTVFLFGEDDNFELQEAEDDYAEATKVGGQCAFWRYRLLYKRLVLGCTLESMNAYYRAMTPEARYTSLRAFVVGFERRVEASISGNRDAIRLAEDAVVADENEGCVHDNSVDEDVAPGRVSASQRHGRSRDRDRGL